MTRTGCGTRRFEYQAMNECDGVILSTFTPAKCKRDFERFLFSEVVRLPRMLYLQYWRDVSV